MAEASGIIRRTSIEASAFDPFGGSWAYYQTGKWESSASVQVDGSGLKVLRETFPYGHAERKGPSISGGFGWGSASFTAVAN